MIGSSDPSQLKTIWVVGPDGTEQVIKGRPNEENRVSQKETDEKDEQIKCLRRKVCSLTKKNEALENENEKLKKTIDIIDQRFSQVVGGFPEQNYLHMTKYKKSYGVLSLKVLDLIYSDVQKLKESSDK